MQKSIQGNEGSTNAGLDPGYQYPGYQPWNTHGWPEPGVGPTAMWGTSHTITKAIHGADAWSVMATTRAICGADAWLVMAITRAIRGADAWSVMATTRALYGADGALLTMATKRWGFSYLRGR